MASARVARWGESLAVCIPDGMARDLHLEEGAAVELVSADGTLVITPARPRYTLAQLLPADAAPHTGGDTDWGPPVGKEDW